MATVTYPGVYVQEISSGVRPIEVASASTAAFVGLAEMGPDQAQRVTNWTEFQRYYGNFIADSYLAYSVFQFFNNGGRQCYIVRVTRTDAALANVTVQNRAAPPVAGFTFSAKNKGAWGNYLYLQIEDGSNDPSNEFRISVRRETELGVVPANFKDITPLEVFDNLSMDPTKPNYVVNVLAENSNLIDAQALATNNSLQRGLHRGGFAPTLPLNANRNFEINVDYDGFQLVALPAPTGAMTVLADIATAIQLAVRALTKKKASTPAAAFSAFTCTVETVGAQSRLLLQSGTNTGPGTENSASSVRIQGAATNDATAPLKLGTGNGGQSEDALAVRRPAKVDTVQIGDATLVAPVLAAVLGSDGDLSIPVSETLFTAAFSQLDTVTDFSLLATPGEGTSTMMDAGMAYCQNRPLQDVFYIGEMSDSDDTPAEAIAFRNKLTKANSYGALYFPWVQALDPSGRSRTPIALPPSGYVAGLYARIDGARGVWKAPAGTEASLNGVVGLRAELTDVQHGNLNPIGVNVIRRFPASGIVSFGARTVTSDPEWKYVPVRRTAIMLRVSIYNGIQWAVFEPNDEPLWSQLRLNIGSFMMTLFRQGAFQGSTSSQAFFVKCDAETTTQADIDLGIVNVLVGFAPLKPAEFVVVRISQKAGQAS
jgi:phage tail sheath protein FI